MPIQPVPYNGVHPLYAVAAFACAIVVGILLRSNAKGENVKRGNHAFIYRWVIIFCLQDGIWGLFASHLFPSDGGLFVSSAVFHLSAILSAVAWTYYFLSRTELTKRYRRNALLVAGLIALAQIVMVIVNLYQGAAGGFMFYVGADHEYHSTIYRKIMFYLQFATYIGIGLVSLFEALRTGKKETRKDLMANFAVNASSILFGVFQMIYPDAPADSIGFAIGCVIVHSFLSIDFEKQVEDLQLLRADLNKALDSAEAASRAKTTFLFHMSHDIRTPMNAITGFTSMAKKHINEPEVTRGYLDKIDISGTQLLTLINQVLEMARIESGAVVLQEKPADLLEFSEVISVIYGEQAHSKGINFTVDTADVVHKDILGDIDRIGQITNNLIGNALKYTMEGGFISFTLRELNSKNDGWAVYSFTVEDTGIGMSEEFQAHIFDEFARESSSTVSHIQGTGLGMSIVKKLVDLLGGSIDVRSKKNEGTCITVNIPIRIDPEPPVKKEVIDIDKVTLEGMRILLVEDNEMNREIAEEILGEHRVNVETAVDGDIAVQKIKEAPAGRYDLVLMDIQMPRMNGYDATRAIRALEYPAKASVPIVAMTANAFEEDRKNALAAGMNGHIAKPLDIEKLIRTIAEFRK